jgi:scyllo-inositol 2-dehydrogenase (NADP+)
MNTTPIKTGICSYGHSGFAFHAPFIDVNEGFHFAAVVERSKRNAEKRYPNVQVYTRMEDLLADPQLELIVVNTPNVTHFEFAKAALEAGKHVVVEKPFTVDVAEGLALIELAKKVNKSIFVYQNRRCDSDYKIVRKIVETGVLGDILEAEFHFDRFKEALSPKAHKEVAVKGTGVMYDLGSHLVDQALSIFGMPEAVFGDIRVLRTGSTVDDYFELLLYYPSLRVRLKSSYLVRETLPAYILHGRLGSFIKSKSDVQEDLLMKGVLPNFLEWGAESPSEWGLLHTEIDGQVVKKFVPSVNGNYMEFYQGVYDCIRLGKPNPVPPEQGLDVIRVLEAGYESSAKRCVIALK